jgi:hypothetical protein
VILGLGPESNSKVSVIVHTGFGHGIFQTANGNERIYIMPYASDSAMWQLTSIPEEDAKALSAQGPKHSRKKPDVEPNGIILFLILERLEAQIWLSCV